MSVAKFDQRLADNIPLSRWSWQACRLTEMATALTYNLTRLLDIVGVEKMTEAITT